MFEPLGEAFRMKEIVPGYTPEEVQALTGAPLVYDADLREMRL